MYERDDSLLLEVSKTKLWVNSESLKGKLSIEWKLKPIVPFIVDMIMNESNRMSSEIHFPIVSEKPGKIPFAFLFLRSGVCLTWISRCLFIFVLTTKEKEEKISNGKATPRHNSKISLLPLDFSLFPIFISSAEWLRQGGSGKLVSTFKVWQSFRRTKDERFSLMCFSMTDCENSSDSSTRSGSLPTSVESSWTQWNVLLLYHFSFIVLRIFLTLSTMKEENRGRERESRSISSIFPRETERLKVEGQ